MESPREQLQDRIVEWLDARISTFTAPYGVLGGMNQKAGHKVRTITFGIARTLDAELTIWSPKLMDLRTSRGNERFVGPEAEAEFYRYACEHYGAKER